jgi:hypothetical protein
MKRRVKRIIRWVTQPSYRSEWGRDDFIAYGVALVLLLGGFGVMFHALQIKGAPTYATSQAEGVRR